MTSLSSAAAPKGAPWTLAQRATRMNPSVIREILKLTEQPGVLSMAGGLPSPDTFPVDAMREACAKVLTDTPQAALQYAASEGFGPLLEWVAARLSAQGHDINASQVLITTGSQQGLDLVAKILVDAGAPVAVETPTYLGALQAFAPFEPRFISVASDLHGPVPEAIAELPRTAAGTRFMYVLPNFQNPTGRVMPETRRRAVIAAAQQAHLPLLEDNPYGDLWFDEAPPPSLASRWSEGVVYMGSFSKVLAPGLRLGYVVAPTALMPKLLQAKQAADLHTPGFNQRVVYEVIRDGFLESHIPTIRARYKAQRDAMARALTEHMPEGTEWTTPEGGMFFWVRLPAGCRALDLLPKAVAAGVAYVPGEPFFAHQPDPRTLRLSFVTLTPDEVRQGVATLASVVQRHLHEELMPETP